MSKLDVFRGLVRPFIALTFMGLIAYLTVSGKMDPKEIIGPAGMIIGFYFMERSKKPPGG